MKKLSAIVLIICLLLTGCAMPARSAPPAPAADSNNPAATSAPITDSHPSATNAAPAQPAESSHTHSEIDLRHLPLGDGHVSTSPVTGSVWSCQTQFNSNIGAFTNGPWIKSDGTYDFTAKPAVSGSINWPSQFTIALNGDVRVIQGNDLPNHPTGQYPIASSDAAYQYDRNPNSIKSQTIQINLPVNPQLAAQPSCLPGGQIGVMMSGAYFFNALDAPGRDAVAHELQDGCQGHPEQTGAYHYHNLSSCIPDPGTGHSQLMGYALDGFGIYGYRGEDGHDLTNADLDACHGHTHEINWDGKKTVMYHYHATHEYPYTVGCFMGTPVLTRRGPQQGGNGGDQNGQPQNNPQTGQGNNDCRPDLSKAAAVLNITEEQLREALGQPAQGRPDLASAAAKLGISEETLRAAIQQSMPANCPTPGGGPRP